MPVRKIQVLFAPGRVEAVKSNWRIAQYLRVILSGAQRSRAVTQPAKPVRPGFRTARRSLQVAPRDPSTSLGMTARKDAMKTDRKMRIETLAVHAGHAIDAATGAVATPIHLSTTFERDAEGGYPHGYVYGRSANPNRHALEEGAGRAGRRRRRGGVWFGIGGVERGPPSAGARRSCRRTGRCLSRHDEAAARSLYAVGPRSELRRYDEAR